MLSNRHKRQNYDLFDDEIDVPLEQGSRLLNVLPMAIISIMLIAAFALAGNMLGRNADASSSLASAAGPDASELASLLTASTSLEGKGSLDPDGYTLGAVNLYGLRRQTVMGSTKGDIVDDGAASAINPVSPVPKTKPVLVRTASNKTVKIMPTSAEPDSLSQPATARLIAKPAAVDDASAITPAMKAQFLSAHRARSAEESCLARAIYFEARSESDLGQLAVAKVILNRVKDPNFPKTICGVVYQGSENRNACQFSFACDGFTGAIKQPEAWAHAKMIAGRAMANDPAVAMLDGAVNYHADYVNPHWSKTMRRLVRIGHHIFYAKRQDG